MAHDAELRGSLLQRPTRLQAAHHAQPEKVAAGHGIHGRKVGGQGAEGHGKVERFSHFQSEEAARCDANDFRGTTLDHQPASDGGILPPKFALPQGLADHHAARTAASLVGSATGRLRRRTASSNWKMAVLAPMPSASVRMAVAAKPQLLRSARHAKRRSCIMNSAETAPRALRSSRRGFESLRDIRKTYPVPLIYNEIFETSIKMRGTRCKKFLGAHRGQGLITSGRTSGKACRAARE